MQILLSIASQFQNLRSTYFRFPISFLIITFLKSAPKLPLKHPYHFTQLSLAKFSGIPRLKLSLFFNQDTRWR